MTFQKIYFYRPVESSCNVCARLFEDSIIYYNLGRAFLRISINQKILETKYRKFIIDHSPLKKLKENTDGPSPLNCKC